jgi:AP-1 complex subunit sigma 1/2
MPPSTSLTTDMTGEAVSGSSSVSCGWHFIVLMSRQGKIRLSEFFSSFSESDKRRILRDIVSDVLPRAPKMCNIIEKGSYKFVYRRYASLYFVVGVPQGMNELIVLEQIHLFVEALDGYFNSGEFFLRLSRYEKVSSASTDEFAIPCPLFDAVCELDLVFSLHKSLLILFEMFIASQLDDGLSFQEQFQLGRTPGRRGGPSGGRR